MRARLLLATVALLLTLPSTHVDALDHASVLEQMVGRERADRGLNPLRMDDALAIDARAHLRRLIRAGEVFHDPRLPSWQEENVGATGGTIEDLHEAFMRSRYHRVNILGDFRLVGIAAKRDGGLIYAVERFAIARPNYKDQDKPVVRPERAPSCDP